MKAEDLRNTIERITDHPHYGEIVTSPDGRLQCHICGRYFKKLGAHVVQKHFIETISYKIMYGLNTKRGLVSKEHRAELREMTLQRYDKCVARLLEQGKNTRFKKGCPGRNIEMVSEQTKRALHKIGKTTGPINIKNTPNNKKNGTKSGT